MTISAESKIRRNPEVVARDLAEGEGGVLLHLVSGQYHGVNQVGLAIWSVITDESTVGEVIDAVRARVEDPPPDLEDDVIEFLTSIHERDLIFVA